MKVVQQETGIAMRKTSSLTLGILATAACAAASSAVMAQSTGLDDLVGARAGQAEGELERRGFRNVGGQRGDDRTYAYWWNDNRRQCVTIATMNGRYDSITDSPAPDCNQQANAPTRPGYNGPGQGGRPTVLPGGPVVDGRQVNIGLVCFGDGRKDTIRSGTVWTWNHSKDRYDWSDYSTTATEVFDASLMVQVWDGGGRIRLPKSLIPPIHSRGTDRWWDLDNVSVGPDVIKAAYRLNGLNKPRLSIDRRSGRISVSGTAGYGFSGTCDVAGEGPRRF